jgi:hypothetical protein
MATCLRTLSVLCSPLLAPALPEPLDWRVTLRGSSNYGTAYPWHSRPYGRHGLSSTDNSPCMRSCHRVLPAVPRSSSCCRAYLPSCCIPVAYASRPWHVTLSGMTISPCAAVDRARILAPGFPQQHSMGARSHRGPLRGARLTTSALRPRVWDRAHVRKTPHREEKTYGRPQDHRP